MTNDLKFLIDVVKQASELITDDFQVKAKGNNGDLVTNFDFEIEKFIIDKIKINYPDFKIVSEEFNSKEGLVDNCFTIDPIDGTVNFAHNLPLWGIQVACIKDGKTCAAVIYLVKLKELFCADETGAYLNGEKIQVNSLSMKNGLFVVEGSNRYPSIIKMQKYALKPRVYNCACIDFAWVACGRLNGVIFTNDTIWDYTPGLYIAKQAGAVVINESKSHIAANTPELAEILRKEVGNESKNK